MTRIAVIVNAVEGEGEVVVMEEEGVLILEIGSSLEREKVRCIIIWIPTFIGVFQVYFSYQTFRRSA